MTTATTATTDATLAAFARWAMSAGRIGTPNFAKQFNDLSDSTMRYDGSEVVATCEPYAKLADGRRIRFDEVDFDLVETSPERKGWFLAFAFARADERGRRIPVAAAYHRHIEAGGKPAGYGSTTIVGFKDEAILILADKTAPERAFVLPRYIKEGWIH